MVAKEREIQIDIAVNSGKPKEIAEKMVEGRMKKFTGEISLTGQPFVKDPSILVADLLKKAVLLYFRINDNQPVVAAGTQSYNFV